MTGAIFAQSGAGDANLGALVRRLVRDGLGTPPSSGTTLLLLLIGWLAVMAVATALWQRDRKSWLRGLIDIRGNVIQIGKGLDILRQNKRPLWVLLAGAVASWTSWSLSVWQEPAGREELESLLIVHENSPWAFAIRHALAAALVPFRDLTALGDLLPLVVVACFLLSSRTKRLARHLALQTRAAEASTLKRRLGTVWLGLLILVVYRSLVFLVAPATAPMADCMYVNALLFPLLELMADAMLLGWVLTEFGRPLLGHFEWKPDDTVTFLRSIPCAALTCCLINPSRYIWIACAIWEMQFTGGWIWPASRWVPILWIGTVGQILGLTWCALPAVLVVTRLGRPARLLRNMLELARQAGGQVLGLTVLSLACSFLITVPCYWIFGSMQQETWSLLGAASYGHYATLLTGIVLLAGFTHLAHQTLGIERDQGAMATLITPPPGIEVPASSVSSMSEVFPSGDDLVHRS